MSTQEEEVPGSLNSIVRGLKDKILATVAATTLEFSKRHPGCKIIVKGSTPARTRLYQMKIAIYLTTISEIFDIQGETETGKLVVFKKGENYRRFILGRKS